MYQLNKRVGFFKKRLAQNEDEKFHYFFIANSGFMYFDQNWFRVRSVINQCKSLEEIEEKLIKEDFKCLEIKKYQVISTQLVNHQYGDQVPFMNKQCFEMVSEQDQYKPNIMLIMFGLSDDTDVQDLFNYVKTIDAAAKKDNNVENSPPQINIQVREGDKTESNEKTSSFFSYVESQYFQSNKTSKEDDQKQVYLYDMLTQLNNQKNNPSEDDGQQQMQELSDQITYSGQLVNNMPHGNGKEFSNDGIQYEGSYRFGKRHGPGQYVDSNLDMHQYEYIMGRPVGI